MADFRYAPGKDYEPSLSKAATHKVSYTTYTYVGPDFNDKTGQFSFIISGGPDDDPSQPATDHLKKADGTDLLTSDGCVQFNLSDATKSVTLAGGNFGDQLRSGYGNDILYGFDGNDILEGGAGADYIYGDDPPKSDQKASSGSDTVSYWYSKAGVTVDLNLGSAAQVSTGDANGDHLYSIENIRGSCRDDRLIGDSGDNALISMIGRDVLTSGGGDDTFIFDWRPRADNVDRITDFKQAGTADQIAFDPRIYKYLHFNEDGTIVADEFKALTAKQIASGQKFGPDDHLQYRADKGALYYDGDGAGGKAAIQVAVFDGKPTLKASDIIDTSHVLLHTNDWSDML